MEDEKVVEQVSTPAADAVASNPTPAEGQTQEQVVSNEAPQEQGQAQTSLTDAVAKVETQDDVNWKNRAMEYERKLRETVENIPKIIQETVAQAKPAKQEPEYSIADLRAFVDTTDDVNNKKWAYAEIDRLESERISKTVEQFHRKDKAVVEAQLIKKQVEQQVTADPRFSDAFLDTPNGKSWNFNHPLTQQAQRYMQDPAVANRPDGLQIAMKLAYADYATTGVTAAHKKLVDTKSEITKLKQQTLSEGGGVGNVQSKSNPLADAQAELAKTGSKTALRTLTQAILKQQGLIN
jgi:hypothetical protein